MSTTIDKTKAEQLQRVLGKAAHPDAIARLLQLVPDAYVRVTHSRPVQVPDQEQLGLEGYDSASHYTWDQRREWEHRHQVALPWATNGGHTTVKIQSDQVGEMWRCTAHCHPADPFNRRRGLSLAFRRALLAVAHTGSRDRG